MDYEPQELDRLSQRLSAAAAVSRAKANHYTLKGEAQYAKIELKRADEADHFAQVCCHFSSKLTVLKSRQATAAKRAGFVPPTFEEVIEYARTDEACRGWPEKNIRTWFDHFVSVKWMIGGRSRMADWKAAARNGARRWLDEHGRPAPKAASSDDPDGWKEFCRTHPSGYKEFRYAADWLKTEFRTGKRTPPGRR